MVIPADKSEVKKAKAEFIEQKDKMIESSLTKQGKEYIEIIFIEFCNKLGI